MHCVDLASALKGDSQELRWFLLSNEARAILLREHFLSCSKNVIQPKQYESKTEKQRTNGVLLENNECCNGNDSSYLTENEQKCDSESDQNEESERQKSDMSSVCCGKPSNSA